MHTVSHLVCMLIRKCNSSSKKQKTSENVGLIAIAISSVQSLDPLRGPLDEITISNSMATRFLTLWQNHFAVFIAVKWDLKVCLPMNQCVLICNSQFLRD